MSSFYEFSIIPTFIHIKVLALDFAFYYPLFMAYMWMSGALFYYFRFERHYVNQKLPPTLKEYPGVARTLTRHD